MLLVICLKFCQRFKNLKSVIRNPVKMLMSILIVE